MAYKDAAFTRILAEDVAEPVADAAGDGPFSAQLSSAVGASGALAAEGANQYPDSGAGWLSSAPYYLAIAAVARCTTANCAHRMQADVQSG